MKLKVKKWYWVYLDDEPHCLKAVRLQPVAASILGDQDGDSGATHHLEAHHIGQLTALVHLCLQFNTITSRHAQKLAVVA